MVNLHFQKPSVQGSFQSRSIAIVLAFLFLLFCSTTLSAYKAAPEVKNVSEEIDIALVLPGIGSTFVNGIVDSGKAFLSVTDLFQFLKIQQVFVPESLTVKGFFGSENRPYSIDLILNTIVNTGKTTTVPLSQSRLLQSRIYLSLDMFEISFGLHSVFNFRRLEVTITATADIPALEAIRRENVRDALLRSAGSPSIHADSTFGIEDSPLSSGILDWNLSYRSSANYGSELRYASHQGLYILDGEWSSSIIGTQRGIDLRQSSWRWQHVNNENSWLRQATIGDVAPRPRLRNAESVTGFQFTNRSTELQPSFGTYQLADRIEPGWMVELYINGQLNDYVRADAFGEFRFDIPLQYGTSDIRLRFLGPWGEVRERERVIQIPNTILPEHVLQCTVTGGVSRTEGSGAFLEGGFITGLTSSLTLGSGLHLHQESGGEYVYPFFQAIYRATDGLYLSTDYMARNNFQVSLNWISRLHYGMELSYRSARNTFDPHSTQQVQEAGLSIFAPVKWDWLAGTSRLKFSSTQLGGNSVLKIEGMFSTQVLGIPVNYTYRTYWFEQNDRYAPTGGQSIVTISKDIPFLGPLSGNIEYDHARSQISQLRGSTERRLGHAFIIAASATYMTVEHNALAQLSLRFDLPFAQSSASVRSEQYGSSYSIAAGGAVGFDNGSVMLNNRDWVHTGGIVIIPFLDLNNDGYRDVEEPSVKGIEVSVLSGRNYSQHQDSVICITNLEGNRTYTLQISAARSENIAWQPKLRTINVDVKPNQFRTIEVPIVVVGEVDGKVLTRGNTGDMGTPGVCVYLRDMRGILVDSIVTIDGGEYSYLGLKPGTYTAALNEKAVAAAGYSVHTSGVRFVIHTGLEGDIVDRVNFILLPRHSVPVLKTGKDYKSEMH